jgi:hypothetical protein
VRVRNCQFGTKSSEIDPKPKSSEIDTANRVCHNRAFFGLEIRINEIQFELNMSFPVGIGILQCLSALFYMKKRKTPKSLAEW